MAMGGRTGATFTDINVTPLTDVFLVLLVIMILVAPLANQTVLKVEAPRLPSPVQPNSKEDNKKSIQIHVSAKGTVSINKQEVQPADSLTIQNRIKEIQASSGDKDIAVELQCDENAIQKYVVSVMDAAAGANVKNLRVLPLSK